MICEPVSFDAGGVLMVGGAFAGWKAFKINKRYFPVSQMPTLAGVYTENPIRIDDVEESPKLAE
jgi:hypothetical protein